MTYATVFALNQKAPGYGGAIEFLGLPAFGVLILVFFVYQLRRANRLDLDAQKLKRATAFLALWTLLTLSGGLVATFATTARYRYLRHQISAGHLGIAEGRVTRFVPMPYHGHANESFCVDATCFSYSDFDLTGGGFNNTSTHGGPIRDGLQVRVSYVDQTIVKLEIAAGTSGSPTPNPSLQRTLPGRSPG